MTSRPNKTLDDVEIPKDENWIFERENDTMAHWYRKNVPAEEIAEGSDAYTATDYEKHIPEDQMAFSMTIRHGESGWTVSFIAPSVRKGLGDVDGRYSVHDETLEKALSHVEKIFVKKGPN